MPLHNFPREKWEVLFSAYAAFYKTALGENTAATVWGWLADGVLRGLGVAGPAGGELCGFAHWQVMLRPLSGGRRGYLHDLFVAPEARGGGAGAALIAAAGEAAGREGCAVLRWATAADNRAAMRLYDKISEKTTWVTYDQSV